MNFCLVSKIKTNAHARAVFKISFPAAGPPSGDGDADVCPSSVVKKSADFM